MNANLIRRLWKSIMVYKLPYEVKPPYTHVVQIGDPVLRITSSNVDNIEIRSERIQKLLKLMKTIMKNDNLVGISAPQVGVPKRIIGLRYVDNITEEVVTRKEFKKQIKKPAEIEFWINPQMKIKDYNTNISTEMCASVVSLKADVKRYNEVSLSGLNEQGEKISKDFTGFYSRAVQHEMDHLDGNLFTDKMNVKTLKNVIWKEINETNGFVELTYYPKA